MRFLVRGGQGSRLPSGCPDHPEGDCSCCFFAHSWANAKKNLFALFFFPNRRTGCVEEHGKGKGVPEVYRGRHGLQGHNLGRPCLCVPPPPALACSTSGCLAARTLRSRPLGQRPRAKHPATCQRMRIPCAVVEAHQSWSGPCECVKPMLYRISLDKEDIKFCTAASDKVCRSALFSVRVASRARPRRARRQATASARQPWQYRARRGVPPRLCLPDSSVFGADCSAQGPQGQSEASLFVLQGALHVCSRAPPTRPLPAPCGWWRESRGLHVPRTDGTVCAGGRKGR